VARRQLGALRNSLQKNVDRELLTVGGPLVYGLALIDGVWQWYLRFSVTKNYERIRLDARRVLQDAAGLQMIGRDIRISKSRSSGDCRPGACALTMTS
jgi:hypothetical protein